MNAINIMQIALRNGQRSLANAYPAIDEKMILNTVVGTAIIIVFRNIRKKLMLPRVAASTKFSTFQFFGKKLGGYANSSLWLLNAETIIHRNGRITISATKITRK